MQFLELISVVILLIVVTSCAICGFHASTRGWEITMPDNKVKKVGYIFKDWHFFWTRSKRTNKVIVYQGEQLRLIISKIRKYLNNYSIEIADFEQFNSIVTGTDFSQYIPDLEKQFDIKIVPVTKTHTANPSSLRFYIQEEEPDYYFPEWIRAMMSECITCHASFYGSLSYWLFIDYISKSNVKINDEWTTMYDHLYGWCSVPYGMTVAVWFVFCASLAYVNTLFWKRLEWKYN